MIQPIPTATKDQIRRMSQGLPVSMTVRNCLDCGRFHTEDVSFCESCRGKHMTTGTPFWKHAREEV